MTKHIKQLSPVFLFLALALPSILRAGDGDEVEKKRTINKSYNVTAEDKLKVENSFGNVVVSTWDKNTIQVDIEIVAKGSTDEKAQRMLNGIEVKDEQTGHTISFKTKVEVHNHDNEEEKDKDKHHDKGDRQFYIDYTIHMPAGNPLDLTNSFGQTTVPDFNGEVNLTSKFGGLTAGRLGNVQTLSVEFGKAEIAEVHNGKINFKFDDKSQIAKIGGNVKINTEFSGHVQFTIADNIDELTINDSYSSMRMIVPKELSAHFDVHTNFGSFRNGTDFKIPADHSDDEDNGPRFDKDYAGNAGDGKAKIRIKISFGDLKMAHTDAAVDEMYDKEKGEKKEAREK
jgi:hypothetical protein